MTCRRDRPVLTALLLVALALGGCNEAKPVPALVDRARQELARGNAANANVILTRELERGRPRRELAALLGEAALAQGDTEAARKWLGGGDFSNETEALGFRMLGRLETMQGNLAAAGRAFDGSLQADADNAALWVDIGRLRYRGGEQIQAIEAADRALAIDPTDPEALRFRGQLARDSAGLEAGAAYFAKALKAQPSNTDLRVEYAATLGDAGRASEALAALRGDNGTAAGTPQGLYLQAVLAARGRNFSLARELLQRSGRDRDGVPSALLLSAIIDLQQENFASAAQQLDRLQRQQPDNGQVSDLLAYALSHNGAERELVHRFAERALGPTGSTYLRVLVGRAYETLGEREKAAQFLDLAADARTALAVLPAQSPTEAVRVSDGEGGRDTRDYVRDAISSKRAMAAIRRARDFASRNPGSGDAYGILGDAELAQGSKAAARNAYERSARVRRPWPLVLRLASTHPDYGGVVTLLEQYVRGHPLNGEAAAILADAYAARGDWRRSVAMLDHAMMHGMGRVPWVLAARSVAAAQLGDRESALDYALAAHELQPMNPLAIAALVAALPDAADATRAELQAKLASLSSGG